MAGGVGGHAPRPEGAALNEALRATLLKVALPILTIGVILGVTRLRRIPWRDALGLAAPAWRLAAAWIAAWVLWITASEFLIDAFGLAQAQPWPASPPLIVALRILAIGLLGPAAEELLMRGIVFDRLRQTRLGPWGAVVIAAVAWSALHYAYGAPTLLLIAADGLLLGAARHTSRSVWTPVAMHALGNLVSIWQSLQG